ncbi:hypothetical protein [Microlunatus sp. Gsoil 973]|uniref:hypothetical protein n=1 Tax=Microlunatus sp. Gsoil 973 TaxID=2672569 RepID=UPI0012B4A8C7|nr:hypothetical protein [Microlunatus sp. Gsoil 973]QGN32341.1 hypothetical protein GJV80_05545 [Microlunatus sp. Gsoil 973]
MEIVLDTVNALWKVVAVGVLLGAGLPALFALALRSLNSGRTVTADGSLSGTPTVGGRVIGFLLLAIVSAIALFGIVVIVLGKQLFH